MAFGSKIEYNFFPKVQNSADLIQKNSEDVKHGDVCRKIQKIEVKKEAD